MKLKICLLLLAALPSFAGCRSMPPAAAQVNSSSSIVAVDLIFRDIIFDWDTLATKPENVYFIRAQGAAQAIDPRIAVIPATWITGRRAYLLNPEPGVYYVVAASFRVNTGQSGTSSATSGNVTVSVSAPTSFGHTVIFPESVSKQLRAEAGPGRFAAAGAVRMVAGDRINAETAFQDETQKKLAEQLRPGVTSATGVSGYMTLTWMVDLAGTEIKTDAAAIESLTNNARADFDGTAWSMLIK